MSEPPRTLLSTLVLVAANLLPLYGVVAGGWSTFEVVALYWFENVVIGGFNVLKMLCCAPDLAALQAQMAARLRAAGREPAAPQSLQSLGKIMHLAKLFFVPFFIVHYGLFTFVHGVFVVVLLGGVGLSGLSLPWSQAQEGVHASALLWAALALVVSHGVSFVGNFLLGGEYRRTTLPQQMFAPYGRVVVLHVAILGGGILTALLGSPLALVALLVVGKTGLDLVLHRRSHRKLDAITVD
jgi:hypothetical protein